MIKYQEYYARVHPCPFLKNMKSTRHSAGLSLGNQVEGLPGVRHTFNHKKIENDSKMNFGFPEVSFKFQHVCVC